MSLYIDVSRETTFGIAICGRCQLKFKLAELSPDPNMPGLMVCKKDIDQYDPYRLPPPGPDRIALPFTRPEVPISIQQSGLIEEQGEEFIVTEDYVKYLVR